MNKWFLLEESKPGKGSYNMAVDDFLFESLGKETVTFIRFYTWKRPTVSIGCSQDIREVLDLEFCRKNRIEIVRRITGGKLVLHHKEVTYSVCSSDVSVFPPSLSRSYKKISESLIAGLKKVDIPAYLASDDNLSYSRSSLPCFSYPAQNEIKVNNRKIVGSAQKRTAHKFIQHGSIPLENDDQLLQSVSLLDQRNEEIRMITASQAAHRKIDFVLLVRNLISGIQEFFNVELQDMKLSREQKQAIRNIQKKRHENTDWIYYKKKH